MLNALIGVYEYIYIFLDCGAVIGTMFESQANPAVQGKLIWIHIAAVLVSEFLQMKESWFHHTFRR